MDQILGMLSGKQIIKKQWYRLSETITSNLFYGLLIAAGDKLRLSGEKDYIITHIIDY